MSTSDIILSRDDFLSSQWQEVIKECEPRECSRYSTQFQKKSQEAEVSGDAKNKKLFAVLACMTSVSLISDKYEEFLARGLILSDEDLNFFKEVTPEISDPELQARVADIIWIRQRNYQMAQVAVESYLKSAEKLEDPQSWTQCFDRIKRALDLAASLGKTNAHFTDVIKYIEVVLDRYDGEDPLFLSAKLMELLLEQQQGDSSKYALLAQKIATNAEADHNWRKARIYWEIKAKWHRREKKKDDEGAARICAAETYVKESEDFLNSSQVSYINVCDRLQKAIEALRKVPGTEERRKELHKNLLESQPKCLTEMKVISQSVDISPIVKEARDMVQNKNLYDALFALAIKNPLTKASDIRQQVEESSKNYIFRALIPRTMMNEKGEVVARQPSRFSNDPKQVEDAIRAEMFEHAMRFSWFTQAEAIIEPARYQINLEHNTIVNDFFPIVANNPFIPEDREKIYAQGLHAGLKGNFLVASHLLIPQIENSIRYLFEQKGLITSGLDDEGIQDKQNINTLLKERRSESEEILGSEDIVFNLEGLLVQRFGANLRNRMAHGLIDYNGFFSLEVSYLWWLTLHLCFRPIIAAINKSQDEASKQSE